MLVHQITKRYFRKQNLGRWFSSVEYDTQLKSATIDVKATLEKYDRSSFILSAYVPAPTRGLYMAVKAFNIEISKINNKNSYANIGGLSKVDLRFKFWSDLLGRVFANPNGNERISEPIMFLVRDSLRNGLSLNIDYFNTYLNSKKYWLQNPNLANTDALCSLGEGTTSQLLYLQQAALLSPLISPSTILLLEESKALQGLITDIAAHIGQATVIANMLAGLKYYSSQHLVPLPIDLMAEQNLSHDSLMGYLIDYGKESFKKDAELEEKLKNTVFKVATTANDHLLASRYKLDQVKEEIQKTVKNTKSSLILSHKSKWKRSIPDAIFVPFMNSIPVEIFLSNLQANDFNVCSPNITNSGLSRWKVVGKSFYNYHTRTI